MGLMFGNFFLGFSLFIVPVTLLYSTVDVLLLLLLQILIKKQKKKTRTCNILYVNETETEKTQHCDLSLLLDLTL